MCGCVGVRMWVGVGVGVWVCRCVWVCVWGGGGVYVCGCVGPQNHRAHTDQAYRVSPKTNYSPCVNASLEPHFPTIALWPIDGHKEQVRGSIWMVGLPEQQDAMNARGRLTREITSRVVSVLLT